MQEFGQDPAGSLEVKGKTKTKTKKKKKKKYAFLLNFLLKTAAIIGAVILLLTYVFEPYRVTGNTMSPFVRDGDLGVFYKLEGFYLNDVILYDDAEGNRRIGRIVATGGQTVNFPEEGGYEVNDYQPTEEVPYETYAAEGSGVTYPLLLGEDEYFVLNDFRSITTDSREIGSVHQSQIRGKLLFLFRRRSF